MGLELAERAVNLTSKGGEPAPPGGGGLDMLEQRVARLESDFSEVRSDIRAIRETLDSLRDGMTRITADVAYLRGRIEMVPTAILLVGFAVAVFVAAGVLQFFQRP